MSATSKIPEVIKINLNTKEKNYLKKWDELFQQIADKYGFEFYPEIPDLEGRPESIRHIDFLHTPTDNEEWLGVCSFNYADKVKFSFYEEAHYVNDSFSKENEELFKKSPLAVLIGTKVHQTATAEEVRLAKKNPKFRTLSWGEGVKLLIQQGEWLKSLEAPELPTDL